MKIKVVTVTPEGVDEEEREVPEDYLSESPPSAAEQIAALKVQIAETDYQIIKCYEYSLVGLPAPYDIEALHAERQTIRDQINALEVFLDES